MEDQMAQVSDSSTVEEHTSTVTDCGRFRDPISTDELDAVQQSRFAQKTRKNALWAVKLFGQWQANRNVRCIVGDRNCPVFLGKPFAEMSDSELVYALPLFLCEIRKEGRCDYPPQTLRQIVISLQKFMEIHGRTERFLHDVKYKVSFYCSSCISLLQVFNYLRQLISNTHRRRDETVELRRVGGVNTPVGSRDPVYNFVC